ncbi:hypothetical protein SISSUDRAFT_267003 [Sistotremastrum suecicum HHB10207 ss-3]|uniref:Uncharacterized protein n=1 Tax=Sistotremastrum suecicum HHB10207 ss-3 TaxID=1314776 RepID=A0A165ZTD0_9AGAM|nr:hypothetical protein SISSUDRAFT_267003 [Sistotremastrum suecicum HHB10207 ss-3]
MYIRFARHSITPCSYVHSHVPIGRPSRRTVLCQYHLTQSNEWGTFGTPLFSSACVRSSKIFIDTLYLIFRPSMLQSFPFCQYYSQYQRFGTLFKCYRDFSKLSSSNAGDLTFKLHPSHVYFNIFYAPARGQMCIYVCVSIQMSASRSIILIYIDGMI